MTSVMTPPLFNQGKTSSDEASLKKTASGQAKEQGTLRGHLRKNGSLRRKNENGPQNGRYWNANGSFRSVLGGGGYMPRPVSIHQLPPNSAYPFPPPPFNGSTRPILDMRLKASTTYLANNHLASQQQSSNFLHGIYNGNYNSMGKPYYNTYSSQGKNGLPFGPNSWQPGVFKPPAGILCFNNMAIGSSHANSMEPRYQPYLMPSQQSPLSFNYNQSNYSYSHSKYYSGQNGMGWQDNLKINAGAGSANGIYYIKNNYGDINNHVNNGEANKGSGSDSAKSKGPLAKRTSGDTVYFNTPPSQMGDMGLVSYGSNGKAVGAIAASEPSIFVSPKGETYKLVSVNGTSYVVPCSPTDIISNGNNSNAIYNAANSGFYAGIPSTYDPYKAPSKVPTFHSSINKVSTSQIKLSSNASSANAFPQVHKKARNLAETTPNLEKELSATTNVVMNHSNEQNDKDEHSSESGETNNFIDLSEKSLKNLLLPEAEDDNRTRITKFSDIALNEDEVVVNGNHSSKTIINSHTSLLEELKMAMDFEKREANGGLDENSIKCKLYPEWTSSQLDPEKCLQESFIQSQPTAPEGSLLSEELKHNSVEDLNMSVLNTPLKPPTRTNTVCCAIM